MNKLMRRTLTVLTIVMLAFAMNIMAFAQGTTMIAVSKNSPAVGDKVTVSVTASESGTITVKYTSSMLNFISCTGSGYTTSGNSVSFSGKSGDVVFSAAAAGTASIIVSSTTCSGSSTTLAIGGGSTATETAPQEQPAESAPAQETTEAPAEVAVEETPAEETPAPEASATPAAGAVGTLNSNGGFDINGTSYVVSERYSDSEMPSGFSKTTVKIGSSTYSEPTNGSITLLYLKPADNIAGSGVFYLYNPEAGSVSEFLMLGTAKNYVIVSSADAGPSSAFTATSLEVTGGTATAYTAGTPDFYYVYGTNNAGNTGWFVYDSANNTVSRMDESLLSASAAVETVDSGDTSEAVNDSVDIYINKLNTYRKVIMGLIVLCVVLVFLLINSFVRSRDKDDDDFDGDVFAQTPVRNKNTRKMPRSIVFTHPSREEDDDYDDEEEYDEDEEYDEYEDERSSSYIESASDYDSRRNSSLNMMDLNDL